MDDLQMYKIQLSQVEAALVTDGGNEELLKLKADLEEIIELSEDLCKPSKQPEKVIKPAESNSECKWNVGDECRAPWTEDGQYYEATIDEINEDCTVNITFTEYGNKSVCRISQLKSAAKRPASDYEHDKAKKVKLLPGMDKNQQREYLKKRKEKKLQRFQKIDEAREQDKNNWLNFANKSKKGKTKKSIFSTSENVNAQVGVGTCGIGGKMTKFVKPQKWT